MKQYIKENIVAVYVTDANGVPTQADILDDLGISPLTGSAPSAPTVTGSIADRSYSVGGAPVTIDLATKFSGATSYAIAPTNLPGVTISGAVVTIDPNTAIAQTTITVSATNSGGTVSQTFALTVSAALAAPAVIAAPTIAGGTTEGSILTRTAGDASGNPAPARETVWLLDGVAIAGQTGNTLDTTGRVGVITTQDIWTNSEGTATGTSDAVTIHTDPIVIAARAYPTDFGTLDYNIFDQIPGAAKATGWTVNGSNAITIADGVLSFNSDAIQPGALTLTGRAEGADNEAWTLAVTFEAIAFSYDGADSVIVSYPADTPADGSIGFTPTGGEQDGRAITFTPADLDGLADGAGFAALAPLVSIAADGGTAGSVDAGDTIALDTPALYLYGGTEPTISYSAHDDGGVVEADITFPWTAPSGMSGSLSIVADDGFGNTAASASIPVVGSPVSAGNLLDLSQPIAGSSPDTWQTQSLSPLVLKPTGSYIVGRGGWPFDVVAGQTYRITWNLSINESASGHSVRLLPDSSGNGTPLASSYNPVGTLDYTATQTRRLWVGPALQKSNALRVTVNTYGVEKI